MFYIFIFPFIVCPTTVSSFSAHNVSVDIVVVVDTFVFIILSRIRTRSEMTTNRRIECGSKGRYTSTWIRELKNIELPYPSQYKLPVINNFFLAVFQCLLKRKEKREKRIYAKTEFSYSDIFTFVLTHLSMAQFLDARHLMMMMNIIIFCLIMASTLYIC